VPPGLVVVAHGGEIGRDVAIALAAVAIMYARQGGNRRLVPVRAKRQSSVTNAWIRVGIDVSRAGTGNLRHRVSTGR
jgi:hypothetical protein